DDDVADGPIALIPAEGLDTSAHVLRPALDEPMDGDVGKRCPLGRGLDLGRAEASPRSGREIDHAPARCGVGDVVATRLDLPTDLVGRREVSLRAEALALADELEDLLGNLGPGGALRRRRSATPRAAARRATPAS